MWTRKARPVAAAALLIALFAVPAWPRAAAGPAPPARDAPDPLTTTSAGDWPMYGHDVRRSNYNPAETTIKAANVSQLVSRWQQNVGNNGNPSSSAPSVASGRVYVGSSVASGNNFFAFDAVSGAPSWGSNLGHENSCNNVGIGSTAAISGTTLVVGGGDGSYYGRNAGTGGPLWSKPIAEGASSFAWESPLLANGRAYLGFASYCDNPSVRGRILAVDLTNGHDLAGKYFVPAGDAGAGIWNSPALGLNGSSLVVVTGEDYNGYNGPYTRALISLDPLTLAIRQVNQQGATNQDLDFGTTPVFFHDIQNRTIVGANHKNGTFYAYLVSTINSGPIWQRGTGTSVGAMPAYDFSYPPGGTLFIVGGSQIYAVDPATGTDRWPAISPGSVYGNIAIANHLIFVNAGGVVKIYDETNGQLLTTLTPAHAGSTYSGVVVANGFVYWMSGGYLNAWSLPALQP